MSQRPIADRLFTWPSGAPALIGSRCADCSAITFPVNNGCPRCGSATLADEELPRTGTVWAWTTQGFLPKAPYLGADKPEAFVPWVVASVELPGALRVESPLVGITADDVEVGLPVELTIVPLAQDADGTEVMSFAFAPAGSTG
ncbi:MAG TPA: OB-fold domain-containing protein [Mycobacteriales bacterium]|nr:OB-fold domain-containing protein [Mycobacteriales bacterium]